MFTRVEWDCGKVVTSQPSTPCCFQWNSSSHSLPWLKLLFLFFFLFCVTWVTFRIIGAETKGGVGKKAPMKQTPGEINILSKISNKILVIKISYPHVYIKIKIIRICYCVAFFCSCIWIHVCMHLFSISSSWGVTVMGKLLLISDRMQMLNSCLSVHEINHSEQVHRKWWLVSVSTKLNLSHCWEQRQWQYFPTIWGNC